MKFFGDKCVIVGIFTMITSLLIVVTLVCVKIIQAETSVNLTEDSTKYPILLPGRASNQIEFLVLQNESTIDWENGFKKCGNPVEGCPIETINTVDEALTTNSTNINETSTGSKFLTSIDFKEQPTLCRCDDQCMKYGDCCASILARKKKVPKDVYWRCEKLLNTHHSVRMISRCPTNVPSNDINKKLCENKETTCPAVEAPFPNSNYFCPLLDVPVYSNKTGNLYRSIFCARCHSVSNHDIQPFNHEILCSSNFTSRKEWEEFSQRSLYQRGKLRWTDPKNSSLICNLFMKQLQPETIQENVPNVRFCLTGAKENCSSLDLSREENLVMQSLCFSYSLTVIIKKGSEFLLYKNPHCAKCENSEIDIRRDPICDRSNPRNRGMGAPGIGTRILATETVPVGINILFHFSLDMDDEYVGFTSKCEEDEILDFIRHKCVPLLCPKGYQLIDSKCEKIGEDTSAEDNANSNDTSVHDPRDTNSSNIPNFSNSSEPCFLIIFHNGEYSQLENGSLAVNTSGGTGGVLIFQPGQYQRYEGDGSNISMSICAKQGDRFESSFAPALSYISTSLLIISLTCGLAHLILYIILPKMRNLPGNNLLCLTACLMISHFIFLTFINTSNHTVCVIASITMHYFLLSGFVWMFVMSFDIWRTFSSEFVVRRYSGDSVKTFIKYSIFAWVLPLIIVMLAVITDFTLPESLLQDADFGPVMKKLRPLYGHNNLCWIGQRLSLFVFFALPVGLIILCNLILFARTAVTIWTQNKEGSKFINGVGTPNNSGNSNLRSGVNKVPLQSRNSGSTKKSDKIRFKLYAKLALIMGLTWILGLLSGFAQWEWLWYVFVIFNGLQGTFIFVAFDCKPKIWKMIKDECGWRKAMKGKGDTGEGSSSGTGTRRTTSTILSSVLGKSNNDNYHVKTSSLEKEAKNEIHKA